MLREKEIQAIKIKMLKKSEDSKVSNTSDEEIANCPLLKKSCLTFDELGNYVCPKGGVNNFYALHLSNLKIFDEPKELYEYYIFKGNYKDINNWKPNKHAPQNMKNVYEFRSNSDILLPERTLNKYILISIQPQHLVNILNGKKTIEIRKQILNVMKEKLC